MTSLDRAKQFLKDKARKLAVTAVPLAALAMAAIPAHAGTLTPGSCFTYRGSGSCAYFGLGSGSATDLTWIQMAGGGSVASGGGELYLGNSGGGTASGSVAMENVLISWYFSISGASVADPVAWDLDYGLYGVNYAWDSVSFSSGSVTSDTTVSGSAVLNVSGGALQYWLLDAVFTNSGDPFSVTIPAAATVDFNPGGEQAATPEPASLALAGTGLAALGLLRRRGKA